MGLFQAPNNATVMSALPRARLGSGGGLLATARNAGMAVVSRSRTLFATRAGEDAAGPELLAGYALALRAGAVLAIAAAAVSWVKTASPGSRSVDASRRAHRPGAPTHLASHRRGAPSAANTEKGYFQAFRGERTVVSHTVSGTSRGAA